jgi:hypothetical protein
MASGSHSSAGGYSHFSSLRPSTSAQRAETGGAPHRAPARWMRAAWPWARMPMITAVYCTCPTLVRLYKSPAVPCSGPARRRQGISSPNSSHHSSRGEGRGDLGDGELREDGDPRIEGRVPISMATWGSWSCRRCLLLGSMSCRWEECTAAAALSLAATGGNQEAGLEIDANTRCLDMPPLHCTNPPRQRPLPATPTPLTSHR